MAVANRPPEFVLSNTVGTGYGWFVDATPWEDEEFDGSLEAADNAARQRVDLLTVVMHELGHVLGFEDLDPATHIDDLMAAGLQPGGRRVAQTAHDNVFASVDGWMASD